MAIFPEEAAALAMADINAVRVHYGIPDEAWTAWHRLRGQPDLRILAAVPAEVLPDGSPLNPTQALQIALVWRLAKRVAWVRGGGDWSSWVDADP